MEKMAFLYKIWIINRRDCCLAELPKLQVILKNNNSAIAADCQVYNWNAEQRRLLMCEPSIMATNVTILAEEADSFSLCEVLISATGKKLVSVLLMSQEVGREKREKEEKKRVRDR